eukprot:CAMPEP_0185600700 /NCGR_PEP_ID=MMETSP0436-20130131/593_1 /TAXON_ID=626734 ORGANISM="Favella taraikaensis, Strain Fe Narragansett Bay" /NCGR_SAMPLE_ID=MMETSP0436 /ASSEMBLY_ACC=CAM_ASM_000390 /LENGTH=43 /DNA_ID= /DNA_START= /DNA_END= /DNA_ORIENTATION=
MAALIPLGGSNTSTWAALRSVEGTLGLFSIVKNRRKLLSKFML